MWAKNIDASAKAKYVLKNIFKKKKPYISDTSA